jgi:hypothetical protein
MYFKYIFPLTKTSYIKMSQYCNVWNDVWKLLNFYKNAYWSYILKLKYIIVDVIYFHIISMALFLGISAIKLRLY